MKSIRLQPVEGKIVENIFSILFGAIVVTAFLTSPFGLYAVVHGGIKYYFRKRDFNRELKKLEKRNYVALTKTEDGLLIKLLKKGKARAEQININNLKLKKEKIWDQKWRLFTFDIPEEKRSRRDRIRKKLKALGLYNIQRSVFAYPFDCREELRLISDYFKVSKYVTYAEATFIDIDKELRAHFAVN